MISHKQARIAQFFCCLYAGFSVAMAAQVQVHDPVSLLKPDAPVTQWVVECDLEAQSSFVAFFSSVSVQRKFVSSDQSNQKSGQCKKVVIHWFFVGVAFLAAGFLVGYFS